MSIERSKGKIGMNCDSCGDELKRNDTQVLHDKDDFDILIADARDEGWDITKTKSGVWEHTCPDCI